MHKIIQDKLQLYFDGQLSESENQEVLRHTETCAECRNELSRLEALRGLFRTRPETPDEEGFVRRVMTRLERMEAVEPKEAKQPPEFLRWLFPSLGYALSGLLMFLTMASRQPPVNADTILLSDVPQKPQSVLMAGASDVSPMLAIE